MNITQHKRLISQIPEDLKEGEEIEVYNAKGEWMKEKFAIYCIPRSLGYAVGIMDQNGITWPYARRPAAAQKKRLKDEPWIGCGAIYRFVGENGEAFYIDDRRFCWIAGHGYDSTDWQNSLESRPTAHQQHMADLDKGIKAAEAGIARHLEQRRATKHVISTCDTHTYNYLGLPECPHCVIEERDRLRAMIVAWCEDHKWCDAAWKDEPANKALFEEAGKVMEG